MWWYVDGEEQLGLVGFRHVLSNGHRLLVRVARVNQGFDLVVQERGRVLTRLPFRQDRTVQGSFSFPLVVSTVVEVPTGPVVLSVLNGRVLRLRRFFYGEEGRYPSCSTSSDVPLFQFLPRAVMSEGRVTSVRLFPVLRRNEDTGRASGILPATITRVSVSTLNDLVRVRNSRELASNKGCVGRLLLRTGLASFLHPFDVLLEKCSCVTRKFRESREFFLYVLEGGRVSF